MLHANSYTDQFCYIAVEILHNHECMELVIKAVEGVILHGFDTTHSLLILLQAISLFILTDYHL